MRLQLQPLWPPSSSLGWRRLWALSLRVVMEMLPRWLAQV